MKNFFLKKSEAFSYECREKKKEKKIFGCFLFIRKMLFPSSIPASVIANQALYLAFLIRLLNNYDSNYSFGNSM